PELRHLENVLQGADLAAAAAEHGRARHGALVGDSRVVVTLGGAPVIGVAPADVVHADPVLPPWSPPASIVLPSYPQAGAIEECPILLEYSLGAASAPGTAGRPGRRTPPPARPAR